jgi:hypothetical protein
MLHFTPEAQDFVPGEAQELFDLVLGEADLGEAQELFDLVLGRPPFLLAMMMTVMTLTSLTLTLTP